VGATVVARRDAPPPPRATASEPVFELGRCVDGASSFATNSQSPADFDRCLVDHARDVLTTRRDGARTIVTAAMGSDLAICLSHSSCTLARASVDTTIQPWSAWKYSGKKDAWDAGSGAVMCAMVQQGGIHITSGVDQVLIETEPGTDVEACFRQFAPAAHRSAR
jgi:hypothetical protein